MEAYLHKLFGNDKDKKQEEDPRIQSELKLAWRLLDTVLEHGQEILSNKRQERQRTSVLPGGSTKSAVDYMDSLTATEQAVFHRPSYYGWTQGSTAGGVAFVVMFGGLRLAAMARGKTAARLPPPLKRAYRELDAAGAAVPVKHGRRKGKSGSRQRGVQQTQQQPQQQPQQPSLALGDDVMMQLQFMCTGAMALTIASFTANRYADLPRFYKELSTLPLQAGRSPLCHNMCPDIIKQYQRMLVQQQQQQSLLSGGNDNDTSLQKQQQQWTTAELLQDPVTQELESMVRLVQNCQQRVKMERAIRRAHTTPDENGNDNQNDGGAVEIPATGVPPAYVNVGGGSDDNNDNDDSWAHQLVADQQQDGSARD